MNGKVITAALCFAMSVSATIGYAAPMTPHGNSTPHGNFKGEKPVPNGMITFGEQSFMVGSPLATKQPKARYAPSFGESNVITTPEGTAQMYSKTSGGFYYFGSYYSYQDADQAATIYWNDNTAYIYNILSYKETFTYVTGTRDGNKLIVPLNQTVEKADDFDVKLGLLKTDLIRTDNPDWEQGDDEDTKYTIYVNFVYSQDFDEVTYTISEDGTLTLVIPDAPEDSSEPDDGFVHLDPADYGFPDYCLGFYYTDDLQWTGDGDIRQEYVEFNYEKIEVPEGAEFKYYSYINSYDNGVLVYVAKVGDEIYVKGLSDYAPEAVFKATLEETASGLIARIPQFQFIGTSLDGYYNLLTRTVIFDVGKREYVLAPDDMDAIFHVNVDDDGNMISISSADEENILVFNYAGDYYDPYEEFHALYLKYQESLAGTPQPPRGAYYEDHSAWLGANYLFFYMSEFTEDGNILDTDELYFRVYVNGEPYEFVQHDGPNLLNRMVTMYEGITSPTTLVPYNVYNGMDLFSDEFHLFYVGFYTWDIESLAVQTVYTYGGEIHESEIANVDMLSVDTIDDSEVVSTEYYTLDGRKVTNPTRGIYIKIQKLSNGKINTLKEAL